MAIWSQKFIAVAAAGVLVGCSGPGESNESLNSGLGSLSPATCDVSSSQVSSKGAPSTLSLVKKWNFPQNGTEQAKASTFPRISLAVNSECLSLDNGPLKSWISPQKTSTTFGQISWPEGYTQDSLRQFMLNHPCVVTAEPIFQLKPAAFPSDPGVRQQNFWDQMRYPNVYDSFMGVAGVIDRSVIVAVIDSGIDLDHQELQSQIWVNAGEVAGNSIDDDNNGYVDDVNGYHFVNDTGDPDPDSQFSAYNIHGTAVAGLIGAAENGIGIVGVLSSHIQLMSLNVLGENSSTDSDQVARAIAYAVDNGAHVINMSLAGLSQSSVLQVALQQAVSRGVVVVAAAGNVSQQISPTQFYVPAAFAKDIEGVLSVGAVISDNGQLAPYSNYSSTYVEIAAPGTQSPSGSLTGLFSLDVDGGFAHYDGTSFSAPLVAGAAALTYLYYWGRALDPTPADIEAALKGGAITNSQLAGQIQGCQQLDFTNLWLYLEGEN